MGEYILYACKCNAFNDKKCIKQKAVSSFSVLLLAIFLSSLHLFVFLSTLSFRPHNFLLYIKNHEVKSKAISDLVKVAVTNPQPSVLN